MPARSRKKLRGAEESEDEAYDEAFLPRGKRPGAIVAFVLLAVLLVVFAWLLAGILMDLSVLPFCDLGYSWFNANIFPFFELV